MRIVLAMLVAASAYAQTPTSRPVSMDSRAYQFTRVVGTQVSGNLSSAGAGKVLSFAQCPAGIVVGRNVRITGGTGTAENVVVTATTCSYGISGTITITTANTHTGTWQVESSTLGINEAIDSTPDDGGGLNLKSFGAVVDLPSGYLHLKDTIQIGNGTSTTVSSRQYITLRGAGRGNGPNTVFPISAGTYVSWEGPCGVPMIQVNGPITAVRIENMYLEANNCASTTLAVTHAQQSNFERLYMNGFTTWGFTVTAYQSHPAMVNGANQNYWRDIEMLPYTGSNGGGAKLGADSWTTGILDVAQNSFENVIFRPDGTGAGVEMRATDASAFYSCDIPLLKINPPTGNTHLPNAMSFYNTLISATTIVGTWAPTPTGKFFFSPFPTGDGEVLPSPLSNFFGHDINGTKIGFMGTAVGANVAVGSSFTPSGELFHLTGASTTFGTITPPTGFVSGPLSFIPANNQYFNASGNIVGTGFVPAGGVATFDYSTSDSKWHAQYGIQPIPFVVHGEAAGAASSGIVFSVVDAVGSPHLWTYGSAAAGGIANWTHADALSTGFLIAEEGNGGLKVYSDTAGGTGSQPIVFRPINTTGRVFEIRDSSNNPLVWFYGQSVANEANWFRVPALLSGFIVGETNNGGIIFGSQTNYHNQWKIDDTSDAFHPYTDRGADIGTTSYRVKKIYAQDLNLSGNGLSETYTFVPPSGATTFTVSGVSASGPTPATLAFKDSSGNTLMLLSAGAGSGIPGSTWVSHDLFVSGDIYPSLLGAGITTTVAVSCGTLTFAKGVLTSKGACP